jgi:importin subunit alpha-1
LDRIEKLQEHENQQIYEKAVKLLETYFNAGAEDENLAPQVSANQQTYTFAAPNTVQVPANGFAF